MQTEQTQQVAQQPAQQAGQPAQPSTNPAGKANGLKLGRNHVIAIVAAAAVIILGLIFMTTSGASSPQVVSAGDNVSVYYTGTLNNGTVFDSNVGGNVLTFKAGAGKVITGFDNAVVGMRLNETKNVTIPVNEAYGEVNPNAIIQVPLNAFSNSSSIKIGTVITSSKGYQGIVKAINGTNVTVDFNPPLAGQVLNFEIRVVAIKK